MKSGILPFVLAITSTVATAGTSIDATPADLILTDGHIKTSSGWANALAAKGGIIVAVGDAPSVLPSRGPRTQIVDLHSSVVLPGFSDVHVHPLGAGLSELQCKIAQGSSLAQTQAIVKKCAAELKPGNWVVGGQWDVPALGRAPDRKALDAVDSGHPVILDDTSGHSAWVNSRALQAAGITRSSVDPPGGIIERDESGEPTGVLRESATDLVRRHVPKLTEETLRRALEWSLQQMLQVGITSYTEAAVGYAAGAERELKAYAFLADAGRVKQRATLCITWSPGDADSQRAIAMRNLYARNRVSPSCVKIFLDGVPTDSHTAAMLQPYAQKMRDRNDEAAVRGMLMVDQQVLNDAVIRFDRMGLTVKFHAAGDAAVRAGLNAIQAARMANGFSGLMHNVGHCTFVSKEDLARARSIGATFEVSPYLWAPSPINDSITAAVGPDLIKRVWPVREMLDSGALVVPGSDWAVVPSVNPWIAIEALVTRELPGGSPTSFGKAEAISLPEAIDLFTVNSARQERMSNVLGQLDVGLAADMIVVDQNPYEVPATRLHDTRVKMTFIAGEKVFDSAAH